MEAGSTSTLGGVGLTDTSTGLSMAVNFLVVSHLNPFKCHILGSGTFVHMRGAPLLGPSPFGRFLSRLRFNSCIVFLYLGVFFSFSSSICTCGLHLAVWRLLSFPFLFLYLLYLGDSLCFGLSFLLVLSRLLFFFLFFFFPVS